MRLSLRIWAARKYNSHAIIYNFYLDHCSQNSGEELDFFSLNPFKADAREVDPFIIFILTEYSMLLGDLKLREIKSFKTPV